MREWRKQIEMESPENGWGSVQADAPLYYEREVDCDGVAEWPSAIADGGRWNASGFARRNERALRVPGAFGPGRGRLPG